MIPNTDYKSLIIWFTKYSSSETVLRMNLMGRIQPTMIDDEAYNAALDELINDRELEVLTYKTPIESISRRIFFPKGTSIVIGR